MLLIRPSHSSRACGRGLALPWRIFGKQQHKIMRKKRTARRCYVPKVSQVPGFQVPMRPAHSPLPFHHSFPTMWQWHRKKKCTYMILWYIDDFIFHFLNNVLRKLCKKLSFSNKTTIKFIKYHRNIYLLVVVFD